MLDWKKYPLGKWKAGKFSKPRGYQKRTDFRYSDVKDICRNIGSGKIQ